MAAEDLEILRLESPTIAGHTLKVAILEAPEDGSRPDVEALRARIAERIEQAPQLGRRLDMSGGRAAWVDDPAFHVSRHVRAHPASEPVTHEELQRICARMMEERLDRSHPLWAIDLVERLEDGSAALIWKIHHGVADGSTAMRLAAGVLWDAPVARPVREIRAASPVREAIDARRPGRLPGMLRRELHRTRHPSPFDGTIGASRAVAFLSLPLSSLRTAAKALVPAATVNDVVLAVVTGGLRRWAEGREGPLGTVRVKVPVSLHGSTETIGAANRDSFFCVALPLEEPDAAVRLGRISTETALRKRAGDAVVLDTLLRDSGRVARPLRRLIERVTLDPQAFALNVSNVAGPAERPSVLGAPVRSLHSVAEIRERHGFRVAVISMGDELNFGLCADPGIVGDLEPMVTGMLTEASALGDAARAAVSR